MNVVYQVDVDSTNVDQVLDKLQLAISPPSMIEFFRDDVADFFREDIESRFNEEGDVKSGFWAPLAESTVHIREQLGYGGTEPINRRTDELFDFMMGPYQVYMGAGWAEMQVPGDPPDPITKRKLDVATKGTNQNPLFPNSTTPPRPVLAVSELDLAKILEMLQVHIVNVVIGGIIV